jgi:hypothetical protein
MYAPLNLVPVLSGWAEHRRKEVEREFVDLLKVVRVTAVPPPAVGYRDPHLLSLF